MAEANHFSGPGPVSTPTRGIGGLTARPFLQRLHNHTPNSIQAIGFLTLITSGGILLLLTCLTLTAIVLTLIFFTPLIILSSPIWFPAGALLFIMIGGLLSICTLSVAGLAGTSWIYKDARGCHPPGSDRVDYARSRLADAASHVKEYAKECSGYLHRKVNAAAPRN